LIESLEAKIWSATFKLCLQFQLAALHLGDKVEVALGLVIADAGVKVSLGVHIQDTTMVGRCRLTPG